MTCCCQTIAKIKDVSKSLDVLNVGVLAITTDYKAIITHIVTGNQFTQDVSTDGSGIAAIDMTSPTAQYFMRDNRYRLHFIETDYSDEVTITMDGSEYDCIEFTIVVTRAPDEECEAFGTQTATLCSA